MKAKRNTFIFFPDKINLLTSFFIVILYGLILGAILFIAFPNSNNHLFLDYPAGEYNEDINPALFVRTTPAKANEADDKIEISYSFFAYIKSVSGNKPVNVRFAYSGLDIEEKMQYFFDSGSKGYSLPLNHHYLKTNLINPGFSKYFIKVIYEQALDEENASPKILKLSETVLTLNKKELKSNKFNNITENEMLKISFKITDEEDKYNGLVSVEPKTDATGIHINMQSWLVTADGKIYPYLGVYNYTSTDKFNPPYVSVINKYLNVEYIYAKAEYRDQTGNTVMVYYKERIADLLN